MLVMPEHSTAQRADAYPEHLLQHLHECSLKFVLLVVALFLKMSKEIEKLFDITEKGVVSLFIGLII